MGNRVQKTPNLEMVVAVVGTVVGVVQLQLPRVVQLVPQLHQQVPQLQQVVLPQPKVLPLPLHQHWQAACN